MNTAVQPTIYEKRGPESEGEKQSGEDYKERLEEKLWRKKCKYINLKRGRNIDTFFWYWSAC